MAGLFGDEDEDDGADRKRKMQRELGAEGDVDELDYEETFQDDEEKMEPDEREDEEAKELEVSRALRLLYTLDISFCESSYRND